jgi:hypothetical protein
MLYRRAFLLRERVQLDLIVDLLLELRGRGEMLLQGSKRREKSR